MNHTFLRHTGILFSLLFLLSSTAWSAETLKPFVMVSNEAADFSSTIDATREKLQAGGFTIAGEYSPYKRAHVLVASNDELKAAAAKSDFGGYGAVVRVSVTKNADMVEVAYSYPPYWAKAFRLDDDLAGTAKQMADALGKGEQFGSKEGLTAKKLSKYHYKVFMPYFDDQDVLGSFNSHADAVKKINENLAAGTGGMSKVFEVKIPGKDETLIGVAMTKGVAADKHIMSKIDRSGKRHSAHLPYAILVSGNKAYALSAKFRIALSFPDLSMMGKGSFFEIMDAPSAIKDSLTLLTK